MGWYSWFEHIIIFSILKPASFIQQTHMLTKVIAHTALI